MLHLKGIVCLYHLQNNDTPKRAIQNNSHNECTWRKVPTVLRQQSLIGLSDFKRGQDCSDRHPDGTESQVATRTDPKASDTAGKFLSCCDIMYFVMCFVTYFVTYFVMCAFTFSSCHLSMTRYPAL
jgi:hypothetical protein